MADDFKIALVGVSPTPETWDNLADILPTADIPFNPDWTFQQYSGFVELDDGGIRGTGLPKATWSFGYIPNAWRAVFRDYCPVENLSVEVYVMTPTNEVDSSNNIIWGAYSGLMKWNINEDMDAGGPMNFMITFDFLEEV